MQPFKRPTQQPKAMNGVWRGRVTRVVAGGAYVEIPRLARGRELGPAEVAEGPWTPNHSTNEGSDGDAAHVHGSGVWLAAGDRVLVAFIEGSVDLPVIIARLP